MRYRLLGMLLFGAAATVLGLVVAGPFVVAAVIGAITAGFVYAPTLKKRFGMVESKSKIVTDGILVTCIAYVFGVLAYAWGTFIIALMSQQPPIQEVIEMVLATIFISVYGMITGLILLVPALPLGVLASWLFYLTVRKRTLLERHP